MLRYVGSFDDARAERPCMDCPYCRRPDGMRAIRPGGRYRLGVRRAQPVRALRAGDRSDIWAWNGSDWIEVLTDQGPIFGSAHSVIVSPKDGSLLVAGNLGAYQFRNGAWSALGVPWPAGAGYVGNVAYYVGLGFVRFDGDGETWIWRPGPDSGWSRLAPVCSPPGRWANGFRAAI